MMQTLTGIAGFYAAVLLFMIIVLVTAAYRFMDSVQRLTAIVWRMSASQRLISLSVIGVFAAVIFSFEWSRKSRHEEIVRQHLRLPSEIAFDEFRSTSGKRGMGERVEAIAHLSDEEFEKFGGIIAGDASVRPKPFKFANHLIAADYQSGALSWSNSPRPPFAGNRRVRWGYLSRDLERNPTNVRTLCFAAKPLEDNGGRTGRAELNHIARTCSDFSRDERTHMYFLALLDYDTKSLHVIMN